MFDAIKLLGAMAQSSSSPTAGGKVGAAVHASPLESIFSRLSGATGGAPIGGQEGFSKILGSLADMVGRAATSPAQEVRNNNPAAVGGLGAVAGALFGGSSGAVGGGLMAVLGSLAASAMQSRTTPTQAPGRPAPSAPVSDGQRKARVLIKAMIQAAKADGSVDQEEERRIMSHLTSTESEDEAKAFVSREMVLPIDIPGLVRQVEGPLEAAEVYAASLLAIDLDSQAEEDYLTDLAAALRLRPESVKQIRGMMGVAA